MPHFSIYGKLVFKDTIDSDELLKFAYRLVTKSVEYQFGINLYGNISSELLKEFPDFNWCKNTNTFPLKYWITL